MGKEEELRVGDAKSKIRLIDPPLLLVQRPLIDIKVYEDMSPL